MSMELGRERERGRWTIVVNHVQGHSHACRSFTEIMYDRMLSEIRVPELRTAGMASPNKAEWPSGHRIEQTHTANQVISL
jgi:hypothetical protein